MNTVKEIALSIASELKEHPEHWGQIYFHHNGKSCLAGHLRRRMGDDYDQYNLTPFYDAVDGSITRWNDAPQRTVQDVIALCEKVAQHG